MLGGPRYVEARDAGGFTPGFAPGPPLDKIQLSRLGSVASSEAPVTPSPKASVHTPPQRSVSLDVHPGTTRPSPITVASSGRKLTYAEQQAYFPDAQPRDETLRTPLEPSEEETTDSLLRQKTLRLEDTWVDETQHVPQHPSGESNQKPEQHGMQQSSSADDDEQDMVAEPANKSPAEQVDKSPAEPTPTAKKDNMYTDGTYWKCPCSTITIICILVCCAPE